VVAPLLDMQMRAVHEKAGKMILNYVVERCHDEILI
jgi:hypothetical protein